MRTSRMPVTTRMSLRRVQMKGKRLVGILIAAVLLLAGSACAGQGVLTGTGTPTPTGISPEQIVEAAMAAGARLDTCQFDVNMEMAVAGKTSMMMDMNGAVDEADRKMHADMQMRTLTPESVEMGVEMYLMDGWVYMKMEIPGMPSEMSTWMKSQISQDAWEQQDVVSQQLDLLADFVEVELLGTEMIGRTECYKLRVTPDLEKLWAWAQMQEGMEEQAPGLDPEDVVSDFSILQWVATDTYFPLFHTVSMTMTIETETIDLHMTMLIHHINEPVTIELPPEAATAVEMPMP